jgi:hypothetical protein
MNHTPTVENKIANLELLRHYAKFLKLKCSCDRGEQVVSHLQSHSSTSPSEFVHIYDSLLQNAKEIVTVGGGDPDDDFSLSASALVLRVRANRCRYLGMFYEVRRSEERSDDLLLHIAITNNLLLVASLLAPRPALCFAHCRIQSSIRRRSQFWPTRRI